MALIEIDSISVVGGAVRVDWTGDGYLYLAGSFRGGPAESGTVPDGTLVLEVHDAESDPVQLVPQLRPLVRWRPVADARTYRVYHTAPGGDERLVYEAVQDADADGFSVRSPVTCADGWHFFRVCAVDAAGNEAEVDAVPARVVDVPDRVSDIAISGTATFTITITE